jgi:MEKHLA domain
MFDLSLPPSAGNRYHQSHVALLCDSYRRLLHKPLLDLDGYDLGQRVYHADFALLSHDTAGDPLFNYANRQALQLFELNWQALIAMPSRLSAEAVNREERERLLAEVTRQGYIEDYAGIRIARSGRRFWIRRAVVWNVIDDHGCYQGQAACFNDWEFLP